MNSRSFQLIVTLFMKTRDFLNTFMSLFISGVALSVENDTEDK